MAGIQFTKSDWDEEVLKSDIPVLVDFWAPWCAPCRMVSPIVLGVAQEYEGRIKVGQLNTDEESEIAIKYGIMSIPTLMFFKDGEVIDQVIGAVPKEYISQKIEEVLKHD
ncbi:MAG: thioredoxin [Deltaproteobacteria bacterium]|nr:thioredoxin [Deltaproteobacteria bacterium]